MLTREQENGLRILKNKIESGSPVTILQGAAGTGKSYLLSYLLSSLNYLEEELAFVSFTGTAAKVLQKQGLPATTIHKLIYNPIIVRGSCVGFKRKTRDELIEKNIKLIIVDEFSMLNQEILKDLMTYRIPLLLVGDQFQLPPIGKPNNYINSADVFLTEVHRQALDNPVLWAATQVRLGNGLPGGIYGNTLFVGRKDEADESWFRKDVQIITGLNKTKDSLNATMAGTPNPMSGHKIIFLKNDMENGITNGTIASILRIRRIYRNVYALTVETEDGERLDNYQAEFILTGDTPQRRGQFFSYAYAISCHKAQGQTFDTPGIVFDESAVFGINSKKWLYTAISRWTGNYNVAILR